MSDSSSYSFNRSHSVAYASLAASTIYLKFKYPLQFFLSLLKMTRFEQDPVSEISKIHKEMRHFGIELLRPHITKSQLNFAIEDGNIRFGLLSIKGISDKSIEKLNNFKNEYSTKFEVFEGANAAELNNNILCGLIQSGCFEGFKQSRCKVVYEAQLWNILTDKEKKLALTLEKDFDYDLVNIVLELAKRKNEKGKPHIKESRLETIKKRAEPYKQILLLNSKSEAFCDWGTEKRLLGYTYGKTLIDIFINKNPNLISLHEIRSLPNNSEVYFIAEVEANAQSRTSKNGNKYISFDCGDETAGVNVKIFTKSLESAMLINDGKTPKKGQIVMIKGSKKEGNCIFASEYGIQNNKIYEKFADIREEKLEKEAEALDKLAKNT